MADFDVKNDTQPKNLNATAAGTSISAMKAALVAFNATSYAPARTQLMSKQDLRYAIRLHGLTVQGV